MTEGSSLQDIKDAIGKPRTLNMMAERMTSKLSSKSDWFQYLEDHL